MCYCTDYECFVCCCGSVGEYFFFLNQMTAYYIRICDWSSDVCSSDLEEACRACSGRPCRKAVRALSEVRRIPTKFRHNPRDTARLSAVRLPGPPMRLLVIDDNRDLVANLFAYFEARGHVLDAAPDGITEIGRAHV